MQDQPEPTPEEEEQVPERQEEHEAMRGAGHEAPAAQQPVRESGPVEGKPARSEWEVPPETADEVPDVAQSDEEIHDA